MSETVHYKGVLREVERLAGENLEEQCKRLSVNKELPVYFDSYQEQLLDVHDQGMTVQQGVLYRVEKEYVDLEENMFRARREANGEITFEVRYYNGGCGFRDALEQAIKNIDQ